MFGNSARRSSERRCTTLAPHPRSAHDRIGNEPFSSTARDQPNSTAAWGELAEEAGTPLPVEISPGATTQLGPRLRRLGETYRHVVVDCGPGDPGVMSAAIAAADVVLVPARPGSADVAQSVPVVMQALGAGVPAAVVLTQVRSGTRVLAASLDALNNAEIPTLQTVVPMAVRLAEVFGTLPSDLSPYDAVLAELEEVCALVRS